MTTLASGHEVHVLDEKEFAHIKEKFPAYQGALRLSPGGWFMPPDFPKYADRFFNFKVKPSDVYVVTYAKVGTTWTQEIVWTMKYNPNLDHPEAKTPIFDRSPFLDADIFFPEKMPPEMEKAMEPFLTAFFKHCPGANPKEGAMWQLAAAIPEPRVIKTHMPFSLITPDLLDKAKVIYVARNPKDVVCSYYHHSRLFTEIQFSGTLDEFCDFFLNEDVVYSPYWLHVKEAWEKRHHPNLHFMLYEDMKADIMKELKKLDAFLGTGLNEKQLQNVAQYTSFEEMQKRDNIVADDMKNNPMFVNPEVVKKDGGFFRQGKTGDGKKRLSPEMQKKMDKWIAKHFNFGLNFE